MANESAKESLRAMIQKVDDFHTAFRIDRSDTPQSAVPEALTQMRHRIMAEENDEYLEACENGDLVEIADALGDMLYVLCGTIVTHGLQEHIEAVFDEIHQSNMSKLDENGQPILREDGKVLKSNRFFRPNLKPILDQE